jgi:hypothetical protein
VPTADDFEKARRELEPDELEILDNYPTNKNGAQA